MTSGYFTLRRRPFLGGVAAAATLACVRGATAASRRPPNIVFVIADDLGVYDVGCYGQARIRTPNIDRLASEGVRFTQAYGGAPICAPSRCALFTGKSTGHGSIRDNFALQGGIVGHKGRETVRRANLAPGEATVATHLSAAGYTTGLVGKWHLDGYSPDAIPTRHGFDEFSGWLTQTDTTQGYFPTQWWRNTDLVDIKPNDGNREAVYETDIVTRDACDFIRRHAASPFFLAVAYNAPHSPYVTPAFGSYAGENWGESERTYAAMIEFLDAGIGSILDTLRAQGLEGETVVFVTSDHGPRSEPTAQQTEVVTFFDSHGHLRGYKRELYEGGIRVPLIVRGPGIAGGRTSAAPVYHPDFLPTALAIAGGRTPADADGASYLDLLHGGTLAEDRVLYWETYEPSFWQAIRKGQWKLVRRPHDGVLELYDLHADPSETSDLAAREPDRVRALATEMARQRTPSPEYI